MEKERFAVSRAIASFEVPRASDQAAVRCVGRPRRLHRLRQDDRPFKLWGRSSYDSCRAGLTDRCHNEPLGIIAKHGPAKQKALCRVATEFL
jgi:hypothetical protein